MHMLKPVGIFFTKIPLVEYIFNNLRTIFLKIGTQQNQGVYF